MVLATGFLKPTSSENGTRPVLLEFFFAMEQVQYTYINHLLTVSQLGQGRHFSRWTFLYLTDE